VSKLRQVEVLQGQGMSVAEAVRQIVVTQQAYYRWRRLYGGMGPEQLKHLKELEKENQRLRRAVSDLTLDKLILSEAARPAGRGSPHRGLSHDRHFYRSGTRRTIPIPPLPLLAEVRALIR
jgi:transposase-like protein